MNLSFDSIDDLNEFLNWASLYSGAARRLTGVSGSAGDVAFDTSPTDDPTDAYTAAVRAEQAAQVGPFDGGDPRTPPPVTGDPSGAALQPTEPAKRKRRTKAEIEADAAKAQEGTPDGPNAGEAALEAARATLRDKEQPAGANPFEQVAAAEPESAPAGHIDGGETQDAVVTPFQHLTRAREFIGKHGMPKYNESFAKAGLDSNVMAYTAEQRALHLDALTALEQA